MGQYTRLEPTTGTDGVIINVNDFVVYEHDNTLIMAVYSGIGPINRYEEDRIWIRTPHEMLPFVTEPGAIIKKYTKPEDLIPQWARHLMTIEPPPVLPSEPVPSDLGHLSPPTPVVEEPTTETANTAE